MSGRSSHNDQSFKNITNDLRRYVEKRLELFVLTIIERVSFILADSIQRIIGILLLAGGFFFLWFALCYYISSLVDSVSLGFLIGSLPLLLVGIIFMKLKPKSVTKKIQAGMMHEIILSFDQMDMTDDIDEKESETGEEIGKKEGAGG